MISKNNHNLFYIKIIKEFIFKISFCYKVSYFCKKQNTPMQNFAAIDFETANQSRRPLQREAVTMESELRAYQTKRRNSPSEKGRRLQGFHKLEKRGFIDLKTN